MYRCRVERHSVSPEGSELISFVIEFPRAVLAEVRTHRANKQTTDSWEEVSWTDSTTSEDISKNSASSRAIPFKRMVGKVLDDPFMPIWTKEQKGMQGGEVDEVTKTVADTIWEGYRDEAVGRATQLANLGIHKQDANRLLEPFAWVTQIVTSSRWNNFFAQRCHKDAFPPFAKIARMMYLAKRKSTPQKLSYGQWHLPFVPLEEQMKLTWEPKIWEHYATPEEIPNLVKFSAARCGWVSYDNADKDGSPEAMLRTYDRFFAGEVKHLSPHEHQATPFKKYDQKWLPNLVSNLRGWLQARKLIEKEETIEYTPPPEEVLSWGLEDTKLWPE
jgi:thymidylate synthase ThyX